MIEPKYFFICLHFQAPSTSPEGRLKESKVFTLNFIIILLCEKNFSWSFHLFISNFLISSGNTSSIILRLWYAIPPDLFHPFIPFIHSSLTHRSSVLLRPTDIQHSAEPLTASSRNSQFHHTLISVLQGLVQ